MGVLTKIEQSVSHNLSAALLAGVAFSVALRGISSADELHPHTPSGASSATMPNTSSQRTAVNLPTSSIVRTDSEVSKVWRPGVNVYFDASLIGGQISAQDIEQLGQALARDHSNWTVYLSTSKDPSNRRAAQTKSSVDARVRGVANELRKLTSFSKDTGAGTQEAKRNVLIVNLDKNVPHAITSSASMGEAYRSQSINQEYWAEHIAPRLSAGGDSKTTIAELVITAIKEIDGAYAQRNMASEAESSAKKGVLRERLVTLEAQTNSRIQKVEEVLTGIIPEQSSALLSAHKEFLSQRFLAAFESLRFDAGSDGAQAQVEVDKAFARIKELETAVTLVEGILGDYDSYAAYVERAPTFRYLDQPGENAICEAQAGLSQLKNEVVKHSLSPDRARQLIREEYSKLSETIFSDQAPEILGILTGTAASVVAVGIIALITPQVFGQYKDKIKQLIAERKQLAERRQIVEGELTLVEKSLELKKGILQDLLIREPDSPSVECQAHFKADDMREIALQAWWILKKMKTVLVEAKELVSKGGKHEIEHAHALTHDFGIMVSDDEGLNFLPEISTWRAEMAFGSLLDYKPPTTTFESLGETLISHLRRAVELSRV